MSIYMSGKEVNPLHPHTTADLGIKEQQMSNVFSAHPLLGGGGSVSTIGIQGPFLTQLKPPGLEVNARSHGALLLSQILVSRDRMLPPRALRYGTLGAEL
jgi:hypothetical protein